ncbi:TolC family protein [Persicitalea jodogahamensis]|uniref:Transporter n=1 Tax=Persicitalea jodogahamensis TaxID=402147 RepID=A0A8J3D7Q2_9BACT|nr:TolC family protein [Persicitalea jodogahamensis]GHB64918.1 transporter [Persicitalea jodogahamensis]
MKYFIKIVLLLVCTYEVSGQDTLTYTYRDYYEQILAHHPVIKLSGLVAESAQRELLIAKGGLDPSIQGTFDRKVYKDKKYFDRGDVFLKVPLWLGGADLKLGYDRNVGETLSDDIRTGPEGISYLGLSVPIGRGLIIDNRRATLQQARVFQDLADAERVKMINKIILTAAKDYWNWFFAYRQYELSKEFYALADIRYQATSQRAQLGEAAAIDTVEALVTLQDRQVTLDQATLELRNARLLLSNHLWSADQVPLELPDEAVPQPSVGRIVAPEELEQLVRLARQRHPELIKFEFKREQLRIDERLGREMLKPSLNLNAAALYKGLTLDGAESKTGFSNLGNNYKFMVDLYFPLFLRKERGKLQQIRIKQLQNDLDQKQIQREVVNEINTAFNDVKTLEMQIRTQNAAARNQELLLAAESAKFRIGESSLFLVNSRESKLNEFRVKVASLQAKYEKALAVLLFASGASSWDNL